jgi:predicted secreted protein
MANEVLANELVILYDDKTVLCTTDFTLTIDKEVIDVRCMNSGGWAAGLAGSKSWSIDFSNIRTRTTPAADEIDYDGLLASMIANDDPVNVGIGSSITGDTTYTGQGMLTSSSQTGSVDDRVNASYTVTGYGALTIGTQA